MKIFILLLLLLRINASNSQSQKEPYAIRISCGARENVRTPSTGTLWYKDFAYTGGRPATASRTSYIVPPLKTLRYFPLSDGPENCYMINDVPNGHYSIRVFFALVSDFGPENEPLFDISVEGTLIYSLTPKWSIKDEQSFVEALVFVTDQSVSICFHSTGHGDPSILSIEVLQVDDNEYNFGPQWDKKAIFRTATRLSCGTGKPALDEDYGGNSWGGDRYWAPVQHFSPGYDKRISTENSIKQASVSPNFYPENLYKSAIVSTDLQPDLMIDLDVKPAKNYSIWMHFAEVQNGFREKGQRVFDVLINGDTTFEDVDIIGIAGKPFAAVVLNKTVTIDGRTLTITIQPKQGNYAIINGLEVFEVIPMEPRTFAEEVEALQNLKYALALPLRLGWNGDPCAPQQHPWNGIDCQFDGKSSSWVIDGISLNKQGLQGSLLEDISKLRYLQNINLSENSIRGSIPETLGSITGLQTLDLSRNLLNGSIPESLGKLKSLRKLNLNSNFLHGKVPSGLGGKLLHRASFNFTDNAGLCGIPGLTSCEAHLSKASKIGIAFGTLAVFLVIMISLICWWKRRQNIFRAQKLAARDAPYAKARTHFVRDVQMAKSNAQEQGRTLTESGSSSNLLNSSNA